MLLAVVGVVGFVFEVLNDYDSDTVFLPFLGVAVALWGILMVETWKRKQEYYALEWGMLNFEKTEHARQEFDGTMQKSLVNGRAELYYPLRARQCRIVQAMIIVFVMICIVIGAVISVYIVQHVCEKEGGFWAEHAGIVSGLLSALQIQVMNIVYRKVALALNNYENHRTNTEYEDSLVTKVFMFQVINSYASLFYIALKGEDDCIESCMKELRQGLMSIFLTGLLVSNVVEVGVPWAMNKYQTWRAGRDPKKTISQDDVDKNVAHQYFVLDYYDDILGLLDDYSELAIQFGYCTFFVVAFPLAPLFAFATCWIEIRSDAYKMLFNNRRIQPVGAQNIGPWESVFQVMVRLAVISNALILCRTSNFFTETYELSELDRLHFFLGYIGVILVSLYAVDYAIPDVPREVSLQKARQAFICKKVIDHMPDEDGDGLVSQGAALELELGEDSKHETVGDVFVRPSIMDMDECPKKNECPLNRVYIIDEDSAGHP